MPKRFSYSQKRGLSCAPPTRSLSCRNPTLLDCASHILLSPCLATIFSMRSVVKYVKINIQTYANQNFNDILTLFPFCCSYFGNPCHLIFILGMSHNLVKATVSLLLIFSPLLFYPSNLYCCIFFYS